jgi:hypothetical protein
LDGGQGYEGGERFGEVLVVLGQTAVGIPDIMSAPRAELAHLLTLQRAKTIRSRIDGQMPAPRGADDTTQLWATAPDTGHVMLDQAPVIGRAPDGTPIVAAVAQSDAGAAATPAPVLADSMTQANLRTWLVKERNQNITALNKWAGVKTDDQSKPARPRQYAERVAGAEKSGDVSAVPEQRGVQYGKDNSGYPQGVRRALAHVEAGFEDARRASLTTHFHSNVEDGSAFERRFWKDPGDNLPSKSTPEQAAQRWSALLALPSLQRFFHLAIDVSIKLDRELPSEGFLIFDLSVDLQGATLRRFATLAKTSRKDSPRLFPCTREECGLSQQQGHDDIRTKGAVDQINGVLDLESSILFEDQTGSAYSYRFSVETLDVHSAAETEIQRDRAIAHVKDMAAALNLTDNMADALDVSAASAASERKLRTAGLQLIDQWRDSVAVKQYVRAFTHAQSASGVEVLDADDLTLGLRLDIGGKGGRGPLSWACLTDRHITFSDPAREFNFEAAVTAFVNRAESVDRDRGSLDGVVVGQPTRLLAEQATDQDKDPDKVVAFAESIVASWDGDPLGMRSGKARAKALGDHLQLSMSFDLRSRNRGDRREQLPFRHRLGSPSWLGARMVLLGGVTISLADAEKLYRSGFALPQEKEYRRVLRHEWIDSPAVAAPWETVFSEFSSDRGLDGERLIVRSGPDPLTPAEPADAWRYQPRETRRLLFAPRVDFTFANLHSVFDDDRTRLLGGMRHVDYDAELGGFPAYSPTLPLAVGPTFGTRPQASTSSGTDFTRAPGVPAASGLAVFRLRHQDVARQPNGDCVANRYFPDPAARCFVVALSRVEHDAPTLSGKPFCISLYPSFPDPVGVQTPGFPHAAPLMLRVVAHGPAKEVTCYQDFTERGGGVRPTTALDPKASKGAENQLQELVLPLAPGEEFVAKIWVLPTLAQIGAWFDSPESMAFLQAKPPKDGEPCARREDMTVGLSAINAQAQDLHKALCHGPVPEFAAVCELRLVHAVERPQIRPALQGPDLTKPMLKGPDRRPLVWRRVNAEHAAQILALGKEPPTTNDADASDLLALGDLDVDRPSCDTVELWVEAAAPSGSPLDDPLRGRSPEDRTRGDWPEQPSGRLDVPASRLLYGFDVARDGRVQLHRQRAIFARWPLAPGVSATETFLNLQRSAADPGTTTQGGKAIPRPSLQRLFSDNGARRVLAWVETTSRTARLIPERKSYPNADETYHDLARRKLASNGVETILRSVVRPAALPVKSLLPAFVWETGAYEAGRVTRIRVPFARPAMTSGVDERVGVVLWPPNLRRIIPNDKLKPDKPKPDFAVGTVLRVEPLGQNESALHEIELTKLDPKPNETWRRKGEIADADLGPGGSYVTRWGADPIEAAGSMTWLIDYKAFHGGIDSQTRPVEPIDALETQSGDTLFLWPERDSYRPRLVENVLMPIPLNPDDDGPDDKAEALAAAKDKDKDKDKPPPAPTQFLMVSLMTYAPRFDVDSETWYVDVEIDPGVAPDPFLRLGLVRFQPHADRVLQVSYPVAEWVQVVGHRRNALVYVSERDHDRKPTKIVVEIDYPVLADDTGLSPQRVFTATLVERFRLETGLVVERDGPSRSSDDSTVMVSSRAPFESSDKIAWGVEFHLSRPAEPTFAGYAIYVEERLRMRRASADAEPVQAENELPWQDSGPRFAVKLEVPDT